MSRLYLSLGANLGDRQATLEKALSLLGNTLGKELGRSRFLETKPWGFASENVFLNAAAVFETSLLPLEALSVTQAVERTLGRTQKTGEEGYADRTIDIDLLFFEGETFEDNALSLPHRHMAQRRFVLAPLAEIATDVVVPQSGKTVAQLLAVLNERVAIERLTTPQPAHLEALQRLLPQLTGRPTNFCGTELATLSEAPLTEVFFLTDEEAQIQGTCTLCYAPSPTGTKAWLEDVVVDRDARGRGYAKRLIAHAIASAKERGAKSLNLTSRPTRLAANRLYQSFGFERRETNVYSLGL